LLLKLLLERLEYPWHPLLREVVVEVAFPTAVSMPLVQDAFATLVSET
jgi:hypothetical protein